MRRRIAALAMAAGLAVGGKTIIGKMASDMNNTNNVQNGIKTAAMCSRYMDNITQDDILKNIISDDKQDELEDLINSIQEYEEMKNQEDRNVDEEQQYLETCKHICESKKLVIDTYTNTIKGKVAQAYGIKDVNEINKIDIKDEVRVSSSEPEEHNPMIVLPNNDVIVKEQILNSNKTMPKEVANAIVEARSLLDVDYTNKTSVNEMPVENIINIFHKSQEFQEKYKLTTNDKGNIVVNEVKEKQMEQDER